MDEETEYYPDDTEDWTPPDAPHRLRNTVVALGQIALAIAAGYLFGWAISIVIERFTGSAP